MYLKNNLLFLKNNDSLQTMSEKTKIPKSTLFDVINGNIENPRINILIKIRETYKINLDDLIFKDLSKDK